jgi:hypothetical protein
MQRNASEEHGENGQSAKRDQIDAAGPAAVDDLEYLGEHIKFLRVVKQDHSNINIAVILQPFLSLNGI